MKSLIGFLVVGVVSSVSLPVPGDTNPDAGISPAVASWRNTVASTFVPNKGCFEVSLPDTTWREVSCITSTSVTPTRVSPTNQKTSPMSGLSSSSGSSSFSPAAVGGNTGDFVLAVLHPTDLLTSVMGSFPKPGYDWVSHMGTLYPDNRYVDSAYSLQMNTNFFSTDACKGSSNPGCFAWQQFIYSGTFYKCFYMEYWLIGYGATCPDDSWWQSYGNCVKDSERKYIGAQPLYTLPDMKMYADARGLMTVECLTFFYGSNASTLCVDSVLGLGKQWQMAEYNIYGDIDNSEAVFYPGSGLTVGVQAQTVLPSGIDSSSYTMISGSGNTAEWNNLTLDGDPCFDPSTNNFWFHETYYGPGRPPCPQNAAGIKCGSNANCQSGSCVNGVCAAVTHVPAVPPIGGSALAIGLALIGGILAARHRTKRRPIPGT